MELSICSQTCPQRESLIEEKRRNKQELLFCEEWPVLGLHLFKKTTGLLRCNIPIIHFTLLKGTIQQLLV